MENTKYKPSNMIDGAAGNTTVKVMESSKRVFCSDIMLRIMESSRRVFSSDIMLRILGFTLTFISAVVVGFDKETEMVSVTFIQTLPPVHVPVTAKWQHMSAFVFFLVSNVIVSAYAAVSSAYSMAKRRLNNNWEIALIMIDVTMMGLLFSATGAALAIGVIGLNGNSHVEWHKVCNVFGQFCRHFTAALVLSLLGSVDFLLLVLLGILNLRRRSR